MKINNIEILTGGGHNLKKSVVRKVLRYISENYNLTEFIKNKRPIIKMIVSGEKLGLKGRALIVERDKDCILEEKGLKLYPFSDKEEESSLIGVILKRVEDGVYKVAYCAFGGLYELDPAHPFWETHAFSRRLTSNRKS